MNAETRPQSRYLYVLLATLLIAQGIATYYYAKGILVPRFADQRVILKVSEAVPEAGHAYLLSLGTDWMDQSKLGASPVVVFEGDTPLEGPNSIHQEIREKGSGRYSVWRGTLYLSASDNTDPRSNGRVYSIVWPRPITTPWRWISYLLGFAGAAGLLFRRLALA